jgi:hypothetical protein
MSGAAAALVMVVLLGSTAGAAPSAPLDCGPYGCDPAPSPSPNPSCSASSTSAAPGDHLFATISDVPVGTQVALTFDGDVVGQATATADGAGQQTSGPTSNVIDPHAPLGGAVVHWAVPADSQPGPHVEVFTGAGIDCNTGPGTVQVLGETLTPSTGGSGSLALTGAEIGVLALAGLVLLVGGVELVRVARRRRDVAIGYDHRRI